MNTQSGLWLALVAAAAVTGASAQTTAPASAGLLGQRYAEIGAGVTDPHGSSDEGLGGDLSVNLPVQPGLDVGFGYAYHRLNADLYGGLFNQRSREHAVFSSVTAYRSYGGVKPFVGASLSYQWAKDRLSFGGTLVDDSRDDEAAWGLRAGVEIPLGTVTLTPKVSYQDDFKGNNSGGLTNNGGSVGSVFTRSPGGNSAGVFVYGAEANMWFTPKIAGFVDVNYVDPTGGGTQAWTYRVGARFRF